MKLILTIEVDESDLRCDRILDDLEIAAEENEGMALASGGTRFQAALLSVSEVPA